MEPANTSPTASGPPAGTTPNHPARHLWTLSILGAALWYPFLTMGTALYAALAARRLRRSERRTGDTSSSAPMPPEARETGASGTPRKASTSLGGVVVFDLALLLLGVVVYARAPESLHRGLVPFGPLVALVVPLLEGWGIL